MSLEPLTSNDHVQFPSCTIGSTSNRGTLSNTPPTGQFIPLRTKAEVEHDVLQTIPAYVIEIPQKSANGVLKAVDAFIRENNNTTEVINIQHLRRIIRFENLPLPLQPNANSTYNANTPTNCSSTTPAPLVDGAEIEPIVTEQPLPLPNLHLLVSSTVSIPLPALTTLLHTLLPSVPCIQTIPIPSHPPTSATQAQVWSEKYWPTIYKKHNPFGPQPALIAKAEIELLPDVGRWMDLASRAGKEMAGRGMGVGAGAVVVGRGKAIVVAGDGRRVDARFGQNGDVRAHAVMRVIALVARKRRQLLVSNNHHPVQEVKGDAPDIDIGEEETRAAGATDAPLTDLEKEYLASDTIEKGGYLCLNLDIFITHEPCVMCSMALLHSRFGRVVFGTQMPKTGGLCAEVTTPLEDANQGDENEHRSGGSKKVFEAGLGYGLFWREELNWRLLAWKWQSDCDADPGEVEPETHI